MAIQFPPIRPGDPAPVDGETYVYIPTQTEYIYDETENSWSINPDTGIDFPLVLGKITAGEGVTITPTDGDLTQGDVQVAGGGGGSYWSRTEDADGNGTLIPTTSSDDIQLMDLAGSALRIDLMQNIDSLVG